jgi:hypothetical protein
MDLSINDGDLGEWVKAKSSLPLLRVRGAMFRNLRDTSRCGHKRCLLSISPICVVYDSSFSQLLGMEKLPVRPGEEALGYTSYS